MQSSGELEHLEHHHGDHRDHDHEHHRHDDAHHPLAEQQVEWDASHFEGAPEGSKNRAPHRPEIIIFVTKIYPLMYKTHMTFKVDPRGNMQ